MVKEHFALAISSNINVDPQFPILTRCVKSEGNPCNITKTILVDISVKPCVLENIYIGHNSSPSKVQSYTTLFKEFRDVFTWTYEEMLGIYTSIVVHEIKNLS